MFAASAAFGLAGPADGARAGVQAGAQEGAAGDTAGAQEVAAGDTVDVQAASLSFHLLTAEPGDALWELFGHNALLVRDSATGREAAFNFGLFDFADPGFAARFVRGEMTYWADTVPAAAMLERYRRQNRRVWAQELDLEPTQKAALLAALERAVHPDHRYYRYDYFRENCSTKLRDVLDAALGGRIRAATDAEPGGGTWRTHTRRLTSRNAVGYLGIQLMAGPRSDRATTAWQDMWVPMKLRDTLAGLQVTRADGSAAPLVRAEELLVDGDRAPEPADAPGLALLFFLSGVAGGLLLVILAYWNAGGGRLGTFAFAGAGALWGLLCGTVSLALAAMHWTDHEFLYMNSNLLVFSPFGLALAVLIPVVARRPAAGPKASWAAVAAAALALAALPLQAIPGLGQHNLEWIAFATPVHLGAWWSMARVAPWRM